MRGFLHALQLLTRLPVRGDAGRPEAAAAWFPVVGLVVGGLVAGAAWLGALADPWLGALMALLAWVWVTGGLHLDGLADLADALGAAHRDRERFLAVLADPHLGAFGAMAMMLQLIAKLVLLMLALKLGVSLWVLVLVPAWARLGALWWSRSLPALKTGLGQRYAAGTGVPWSWLAALAAASLAAAPALLAAPLVILAWRGFLKARLGGMNGDCLGAGIEVAETLALLLSVACAAA